MTLSNDLLLKIQENDSFRDQINQLSLTNRTLDAELRKNSGDKVDQSALTVLQEELTKAKNEKDSLTHKL